jgi:hypothetical protein
MPHAQSPSPSAKEAAPWKNDLARDGFAIVKSVIPEEKAAYYVEQMNEWLEGFGLGYNRSDPSTWKLENVPVNMKYVCLFLIWQCINMKSNYLILEGECITTMRLLTRNLLGMLGCRYFNLRCYVWHYS